MPRPQPRRQHRPRRDPERPPAGSRPRRNVARDHATVSRSRWPAGAFASGGGSFSVRGRLAQVVYTLTQFATVTRVSFKLDGQPVTVFSSEGIILDTPVTRVTYRDDFLPRIFVDRPAWGAALPSPNHVTGLANTFEAQFRMALLDAAGKVLVDRSVLASAGSGTWGTFDVAVSYTVPTRQWGTLRVWDTSAKDGTVILLRSYPIQLWPGS